MNRNWQKCPRDPRAGRWAELYVTLNPKGNIVFNRRTYDAMGQPTHVFILYDPPNNLLGLQPTDRSDREAYPVASSGNHGGRMIRAFRIFPEFGIKLTETVRFVSPELDRDGVLLLDLRQVKRIIPGRVYKKANMIEL